MGYLPKSEVEKKIKARKRIDKHGNERVDYEAYFGIDPFTQRPVRISRGDLKEVNREIIDFYARHRVGGDAAVRLTAIQAIDAKNAYDALAAANMKTSLYDAVSAYISGTTAVSGSNAPVTVGEAYERFIKTKHDGADKLKTIATSGRWAKGVYNKKLASVAAQEVTNYLDANFADKKPKTYNSHLLYLKTFFNWCCKEEINYLVRNPIKSVAFKPEPWEEPEYMKPQDVKRLFRLLEAHKTERPDMLAYAVVSFFCGSRTVEILRMAEEEDAAKINIADEMIRIAKGKGFQLGRRPRAFHIEPTALAWMKSFDFLTAIKGVTRTSQKDIYDMARANGIPVFQNCGRHTFITYHVAAYGDPTKTQAIVGTSEKMRADNYCGLASKADGEAYFRIMPADDGQIKTAS